MAVVQRTERRRHGRYSGEAARGLRRAFHDGGGTGRRTHLRGSWAVAVSGAVRAMGCPSSSSSATVRASPGGALARPGPPATSPWSPQAPPRLQLWRAVAEIIARQRQLGQRRWFSLGPKYT
jgi:hypothetical protein